ncbi:hypothetical protein BDV27DRAFT_119389 [Aspergillus caelatus]|uniref:Uncharacterized protein n=1 Tax=Aspergillus caelatus TaxID=61420 RepID=A0A5N7ANB2_9EURO|nr:uncharacterized protein BDV27DRAFT_119389 [Aspergillus caelatus]KAE8370746.1 hypothetical protein BDV27DRAFT_119389 [Aspergillus caelatus]
MASDRIAKLIKDEALVQSLDDRAPEYAALVQSSTATALRNSETADLLEVTVWDTSVEERRRVYSERPPFNTDWAALFYKYLRERSVGSNRELETGIDTVIKNAVLDASQEYYTSEETIAILSGELVKQVDMNEKVRKAIYNELQATRKLAIRESRDAISAHTQVILADRMHDVMAQSLNHAVVNTTVGSVVGHMVLSAMALPAVKVAITHSIIVAVHSAAVQHILVLAGKKIGVTVLLTLIFGHAAASLAGWFVLPIIAAFVTYQYQTLPDTLAKKIPRELAEQIKQNAPTINKSIAEGAKKAAMEAFFSLSDKSISILHDAAMRPQASRF